MQKKLLINKHMFIKFITATTVVLLVFFPADLFATQLHASSEGIITHQMGHLFFLFSMVTLIFTITGKGLDKQKGWRLIQYSAFFFILWNLDAILAHFLDNQIHAVKIENISLFKIKIISNSSSLTGFSILALCYYAIKLDHLLCVPAMLFLYRGLSNLVTAQREKIAKEDSL